MEVVTNEEKNASARARMHALTTGISNKNTDNSSVDLDIKYLIGVCLCVVVVVIVTVVIPHSTLTNSSIASRSLFTRNHTLVSLLLWHNLNIIRSI